MTVYPTVGRRGLEPDVAVGGEAHRDAAIPLLQLLVHARVGVLDSLRLLPLSHYPAPLPGVLACLLLELDALLSLPWPPLEPAMNVSNPVSTSYLSTWSDIALLSGCRIL